MDFLPNVWEVNVLLWTFYQMCEKLCSACNFLQICAWSNVFMWTFCQKISVIFCCCCFAWDFLPKMSGIFLFCGDFVPQNEWIFLFCVELSTKKWVGISVVLGAVYKNEWEFLFSWGHSTKMRGQSSCLKWTETFIGHWEKYIYVMDVMCRTVMREIHLCHGHNMPDRDERNTFV